MPGRPRPAWAGLKVSVSRKPYPAVRAFVDRLRALHGNGGACFASFRFPGASAAFSEAAGRGLLIEAGFFDHFWQTDGVRRALPELAAPPGFTCGRPFVLGNPFTLDGEFASALFGGGAYSRYEGTTEDAKADAAGAAAELLGSRFEHVQVYINHAEWCDYFGGMIDWTWVVVDHRAWLLHVLCATDVD